MPTVYLSPIGNGFQFLTTGGAPLNGGLIATYAAGTSTPQATFTTNLGTVTSANPIVLGSDGRPSSEIWFTGGLAYKFLLADSLSSSIASYDNLYGINDPTAPVSADNTGAAIGFVPITTIAGTANAITGAVPASFTAYGARQCFRFIPALTNTGATAIVLTPIGGTALASRNIFLNGVALAGGELQAGIPTVLEDDGTQLNIVGNGYVFYGSSAASVTAASVLNLDTMTGDYGQLFGSTQITSITLSKGRTRTLEIANVVNISANASILLPGNAGLTANTGDVISFRGESNSIVRAVAVQRNSQAQSVISVQAANTVFAGPTSGVSGAPSFRSLTGADLGLAIATQAEMEAATTTGAMVTPGRQQFHPSAPKAWGKITPPTTVNSSYPTGATVVHPVAGKFIITTGVTFSNADFAASALVADSSGNNLNAQVTGFSVTSLTVAVYTGGSTNLADPNICLYYACYGDLP